MNLNKRFGVMFLVVCCAASYSPAEDAQSPAPLHDLAAVMKASKWGQKPVAERRDALLLKTYEDSFNMDDEHECSALLRELVRQAFLISGREMLGLTTRDQTLREPIFDVASDEASVPVDERGSMQIVSTVCAMLPNIKDLRITVFRETKDGPVLAWERKLAMSCPPSSIVQEFAAQLEVLSRNDFTDVLKAAGYSGPSNQFVESGPVPAEAADVANDWNMLPQYFAIRALHNSIRELGESPERLAALAESYARLGSLTNFHLSPAPDAFNARALMYAQRLIALTDDSVLARQTRAYVFAIIGLHQAAKEDLHEIMRRDVKLTDEQRVLISFCEFDNERLEEFANDDKLRALVRYLQFLAIEPILKQLISVSVAEALIEEQQDCFNALDRLAELGSLATCAQAASQAHLSLFESVTRRLRDREELPDNVKELIKRRTTPLIDSPLTPNQQRQHVELIAALRSASTIDKDRSEPSLACLAQLIFECGFAQAVRSVHISAAHYGLPLPYIAKEVNEFRPMFEGHPLADGLLSYGRSVSDNEKKVPEFVNSLDSTDLVYAMIRMAAHLGTDFPPVWKSMMIPVIRHQNPVYRDLSLRVSKGTGWSGDRAASMLPKISPESSMAALGTLRFFWKSPDTQAEVKRIETQFAGNAYVTNELAQRYLEDKDWPAAERLLKQVVELEHSSNAYQELAMLYKAQENWDQWVKNMTACLDMPEVSGLGHARIRNLLAKHYMDLGDYAKALPYAEAAAESGAQWAMATAFRCYEELGDLDQSHLMVKYMSQRYDGAAFEWYYWCRRNAAGDLDGARKRGLQRIASLGEAPLQSEYMDQIAIFRILESEYKDALKVTTDSYDREKHPFMGLQAALIAGELSDRELQGRMLLEIVQQGNAPEAAKERPGLVKLASLFNAGMLEPDHYSPLDLEQADKIVLEASPKELTNLNYFIGTWLRLQGQSEDAIRFLKVAAQSSELKYNRTLAAAFLHDKGIDF